MFPGRWIIVGGMRWFVAPLLVLIGLIGGMGFVLLVADQARVIQTGVATPAKVLDSHIDVHRGKSSTYLPVIHYRYRFGEQTYESTRLQAFEEHSSRLWAQEILDQYPVGVMATAYVDPSDPTMAILLRDYSLTPYVLSIALFLVAVLGMAWLMGLVWNVRTKMVGISMGAEGWTLLMPQWRLRTGLWRAVYWWVGITAAVVPLLGHFLWASGRRDAVAALWAAAAGVVWVGLGIWAYRRWRISGHVSDARLQVNPAPMELGKPLRLRVELDALSPLRVSGFRAKLVCVQHYKEKRGSKTVYGTRVQGERSVEMVEEGEVQQVSAGEVLAAEGEVVFEGASWPGSWDGMVKMFPYFTWEVRVSVELLGMVDYAAVFPVEAG